MDYFLNQQAVDDRLLKEYIKNEKLCIAYDFDDTVYDFHNKGRKYNDVIKLLRKVSPYSYLIVLTGNPDLEFVSNYLEENDIPYDSINNNEIVQISNQKVYYNLLLDDRAGLRQAYETLYKLNVLINKFYNIKDKLIEFIREKIGDKKAVIGISGGKDSTICAKLCVEALGKENVIGVLMPDGIQHDIPIAKEVTDLLDISNTTININEFHTKITSSLYANLSCKNLAYSLSKVTTTNLPARIRMTLLYAISGSCNGRVINTCNLSEDYVGYSTKFGDGAGDISLLGDMTVTEVLLLGKVLGLPNKLINKIPEDGLSGLTDEENLGVSYDIIDKIIRGHLDLNIDFNGDATEMNEVVAKVKKLNDAAQHKLSIARAIPTFQFKF